MPRFVLLRHECPADGPTPSHWDLMIEREGVLLTWRLLDLPEERWVPGGPGSHPTVCIAAERLADHRLDFLEYEGALSGGRGSVSRVDRGELKWLNYSADRIEAQVEGSQVRCLVELIRVEEGACWRLTLRDEFAK